MTILFACNNGFNNTKSNPFAKVLADGLESLGHFIEHGPENFWNRPFDYDLIFIQWPESLFEWRAITENDIVKLSCHLQKIIASQTKMLVTCHNLKPHNNDHTYTKAYSLVYESVDAIHHMGQYSYDLLKKRYPTKLHFIAPHPVYYDMKSLMPSKEECRRHLQIPIKSTVMLCFGAFRNEEERQMIYDIKSKFPALIILAPRFLYLPFSNGWRPAPRNIWYFFYLNYLKNIRVAREELLHESEIKYYLGAADFLFIQRKRILNSGNLPLAFSAGLPVVGPAMGNVGSLLEETGNITFDPNDKDSILSSTEHVLFSNMKELGYRNYEYSKVNWNAQIVCSKIDNIIRELCNQ